MKRITDIDHPDFTPMECPECGGEADCTDHMESNINYGFFKSVDEAEQLAEATERYRAKQKRRPTVLRLAAELKEKSKP
jgi:hypothetical protein